MHDRTGAQIYGSRRDLREQFAYDGLQRLTTSTVTTGLVTTPPSLVLTYDSEGNIQTRSVGGGDESRCFYPNGNIICLQFVARGNSARAIFFSGS